MTVTTVERNPDALTLTLTAEFDVDVDRAWQLWADPRQLERWWGPPGYPATVVDHDLKPGGRVTYYMTGPDGDQPHGWWKVVTVKPPSRLEIVDGFADENGTPNDAMPTMTMTVLLSERSGGGTVMVTTTKFRSVDEMERILEMGMEEGMRAAAGQIDAILKEPAKR